VSRSTTWKTTSGSGDAEQWSESFHDVEDDIWSTDSSSAVRLDIESPSTDHCSVELQSTRAGQQERVDAAMQRHHDIAVEPGARCLRRHATDSLQSATPARCGHVDCRAVSVSTNTRRPASATNSSCSTSASAGFIYCYFLPSAIIVIHTHV